MGQDFDAQSLTKSAGAPEGSLSIFGSTLSAKDGSSRRQVALDLGRVPNQVLTVDEMGQDFDVQSLTKSAGAPGGSLSIFGSALSAKDGSSRRQLALDLGLARISHQV